LKFPHAGRIEKPTDLLKQPFQGLCRILGRGVFHLARRIFPPRPAACVPVTKVLLVRRNRLGDAVCLLPAIQALKEADPGIHVAVLASPYNAAVFALSPVIDRVYALPERHFGNRWLLRWHPSMRAIRRERYDLAISATLSHSSHAARLCWYSGARRRAGVASVHGSAYDLLFDLPVSPERISAVHQVEKAAVLLRLAGLPVGTAVPAARLIPASPAGPRRADLVCLCPEVQRRESAWPAASYAALVAELRRRWPGVRIQVVLQDAAGPYARLAELDGVERVETPSFREFAAKLSEAALVVCSEGGASHLAPALGAAAVVLSGKAIRHTWSPWSERALLLEKSGDAGRIGVEEVLAAVEAQLGSRRQ
jgi:ADP-heptose:LPS heptosyltransferase